MATRYPERVVVLDPLFSWPVLRNFPALPSDTNSSEYAQAAAEQRAAAQLAVTVMHALSGRQFGVYEHVVRPCRPGFDIRRDHNASSLVTSYLLSWEGDRWVNWSCGCVGGCALTGPRAVHLPGPVKEVTKVEVAGVELADSDWTLEGAVLYRAYGPWPRQDLGRPLGEPNTWAVTYLRGMDPPEGTAALTGLLAKEFLLAITADANRCRLPRTVTTVSRGGVTYRAYDPAVIYANGKTGLPEIDLWLASVNPHALVAPPTVI